MAKSSPNGQKSLWRKEKLLVTSNFSFSLSVFKRLVLQKRKKQVFFGKGSAYSCQHDDGPMQILSGGNIKPRNCRLNKNGPILIYDKSVENADVAFVKGANERNEFFEKINKQ